MNKFILFMYNNFYYIGRGTLYGSGPASGIALHSILTRHGNWKTNIIIDFDYNIFSFNSKRFAIQVLKKTIPKAKIYKEFVM